MVAESIKMAPKPHLALLLTIIAATAAPAAPVPSNRADTAGESNSAATTTGGVGGTTTSPYPDISSGGPTPEGDPLLPQLKEDVAEEFKSVIGLQSKILGSFVRMFSASLKNYSASRSGGRNLGGEDAVLRSTNELSKGLSELADHLQNA